MSYLIGDVREKLADIPSDSIQCVVTSPPYWGLRDYGVAGQLGLEPTPQEYVANMRAIFSKVRRVLRPDGVLWLNLGDTYAGGGNNRGNTKPLAAIQGSNSGSGKVGEVMPKPRPSDFGLKPKDLVGIPWRVAFALQDEGWYLRQDIIWAKRNPMPESVTDRCTKSHEYLFMLTKRPRYKFNVDAISEAAISGWKGSEFHTGKTAIHQMERASKVRPSKSRGEFNGKSEAMEDEGRNAFRAITERRRKRSVWTLSNRPFTGAHFATFPPDLVEPCILASTGVGDVVLDPFMGSGTTAAVAEFHERKWIGIELNQSYADLYEDRKKNVFAALQKHRDRRNQTCLPIEF